MVVKSKKDEGSVYNGIASSYAIQHSTGYGRSIGGNGNSGLGKGEKTLFAPIRKEKHQSLAVTGYKGSKQGL